jgi:hypothetical protein
MNKLIPLFAAGILTGLSANADLIAGWDFQTTTNGGTAGAAAPGSPLVYAANFGSGTIYLDGSNGSSTWTSAASNPQVTSFGGSNLNTAGTGFSTDTSGASSLSLANSSANGFRVVFSISMAGYEDLVVSYATRGTSTGFTSHDWSYSTDASTWTSLGSITGTTSTSYSVKTLSTITALNNSSTAYLSLVLPGATSATGNNRLDNIQFNATVAAVPEPATAGLLALGLLLLRRRR